MQPARAAPASAAKPDRRTSVTFSLGVRGASCASTRWRLLASEALAHALEQPEEQGHEENGDAGRSEHAADHPGADGTQAVGARTRSDRERHATQNEREGGHDD